MEVLVDILKVVDSGGGVCKICVWSSGIDRLRGSIFFINCHFWSLLHILCAHVSVYFRTGGK